MNSPCTIDPTADAMIPAPASRPVSPQRSVLVTAVGCLAIVAGALGSVISVISFLMLLARSYGTNTGGLLDWLIVLAGPPVTLLAGIGLLRRKRWAWVCLVGILFAVLVWQGYQILNPPPSETTTHVSPSGVKTTVIGSGPLYSVPVIVGSLAMLAVLLSPRARAEFARARTESRAPVVPARMSRAEPERDWRVGHTGRDMMYYEEQRDGAWQRIAIDGEMLMGRAHHVIYFASPEQWQQYPGWARHRRDEIIARIQSAFREPDYEYAGGGGTGVPASRVAAHSMTPSQFRALLVTLVILLGITGLMAWLVQSGLQKNETWWPSKRASLSRTVTRGREPAMFWTSIGVYTAIGLGTFGLAVCLVRWSRGEKKT